MTARIKQRDDTALRDAKARHNISDLIARHVKLRKRGAQMVGLCPFHADRTPSFEVSDTKGVYHCFGCGAAGDHVSFLMEKEGMTFRQAYEALTGDNFPEVPPEEQVRRREADAADVARRVELARSIWKGAGPLAGSIGERYVRDRGIRVPLPGSIRFARTPRWYDHDTGRVGPDHPAVVCALQNGAGAVVGVQCIFLRPDGRAKYDRPPRNGKKVRAKLSFGTVAGSAIRLGPIADDIIVCEGPEDGWTLMQELPGRSVWVACGTAMMPRMEMPPGVRSITLAGDNGHAGQLAVINARTAYAAQGLGVSEIFPEPPFKDWNDQLQRIS